ncbi:glycosyltransferase [Labilibacter sediminis]|nr:glycosyltransferase [Labilibacter sediminis]
MEVNISVIIPNYNNAAYLTQCIESVFQQSHQPIECLVIDDGSTDNSINVLQTLKEKFNNLHLYSQENAGPSVARNSGIKKAKGNYIALLDSDDYWSPDKLWNQVQLIECGDEVISSHCDYINSKGQISKEKKYILPPYHPFDFLAKNALIGSCSSILFPKNIVNNVGYYNTDLKSAEDLEFHFRIALESYTFKHVQQNDVHIRWHSNNSTKDYTKVLYFQLMAFDLQIKAIHRNYPKLLKDEKRYKSAIIERIGKIRFWANLDKNKSIKLLTYFLELKHLGKKQLIKTLINNVVLKLKKKI